MSKENNNLTHSSNNTYRLPFDFNAYWKYRQENKEPTNPGNFIKELKKSRGKPFVVIQVAAHRVHSNKDYISQANDSIIATKTWLTSNNIRNDCYVVSNIGSHWFLTKILFNGPTEIINSSSKDEACGCYTFVNIAMRCLDSDAFNKIIPDNYKQKVIDYNKNSSSELNPAL
jgi:hypothetical protein